MLAASLDGCVTPATRAVALDQLRKRKARYDASPRQSQCLTTGGWHPYENVSLMDFAVPTDDIALPAKYWEDRDFVWQ